jgi:tetratricopeptide (TPR) repeat protein
MKNQPPRSRSGSRYPARHQFDHVVPTVIHHPEEKMTALGRWTHRLLKDRQNAATWGAVIVAGLLLGVVAWNVGWSRSRTTELWNEIESAKKTDDRVALAKENPASPAASWALLQAATEFYNQALADMPNNRDVAGPMFKRALDLFDQVVREAPKDSPQARAAALGEARSLEARYELSKAIEQYRLVAKTWPSTPEAAEAAQLADALEKPEAAAFYKELFAYSPTKVTLPPLGSGSLNLPFGGPAGSTPPTAGGSPIVPEMPIELAPPEVREVKKPETKTKVKVDTKAASPSPPVKTDTSKGSAEKPKPAAGASPPKPDTKPSAPKSK